MKKQISPCKYSLKQLFQNLKPFLTRTSPFSQTPLDEDWYQTVLQSLETYKVLVVGAGGLGCEIVKNLALNGFRKIHLIDMDTIDLTNLNRQFLFRKKDINKKKAEIVAEFVMRRCPGVQVIPYTCRVQQLSYNFYSQFGIIIGGLDNVQARKFLNIMTHQINLQTQQTACIYIDGATEGFSGQCVVVQPFITSCYNCSIPQGLNNQVKANYCTISNTPRTPQHCIQYVLQVQWQNHYPNTKRDNDNLAHMKWIYQKSLERAQIFKIEGVTQMLTLGLAKNIIPAIASTNALIAAFSTNQALKIAISTNPKLKNYFLYYGGTSTGSNSYLIQKKPGCPACQMRKNKLKALQITINQCQTLSQLLKKINQSNPMISIHPFININNKLFYNPADTIRREQKLKKTIKQLQQSSIFTQNPQFIIITDISLKSQQEIYVKVIPKEQKHIQQNQEINDMK